MGKTIIKYLKTFSNAIKIHNGIIIKKYRHSFMKGISVFEGTVVLEVWHTSTVKDIVISLLLVRLRSTGFSIIMMKNINMTAFI
ncbi:MAG: hypothetical protein HQL05_13960 [Nitrospirae bacterium]|nr:hypothetical protein [Nitrospirota bacterium]